MAEGSTSGNLRLVLVVFVIIIKRRKKQAQIRQMEAQARAIQDAVEQQATRLEREFEDGYLAAIKQAFAPIETAFIEQSRALDQKSQALTSDRAH
ncbi:hypothetical protein [Chromatium okenii]|nr:hypothetical protein [Chromatium okenii]